MKAPLKNYTLGALQTTQSLRKAIFGQHTSGMHFSSNGIDCVALKEGALEKQTTNSIITRRGIDHRWIYANGWHAASAFGFVSCVAFPFFRPLLPFLSRGGGAAPRAASIRLSNSLSQSRKVRREMKSWRPTNRTPSPGSHAYRPTRTSSGYGRGGRWATFIVVVTA